MKMDTSGVLNVTLNVRRPEASGKVCSMVLGIHKAMGEQREKEFRDQHDDQAACDSFCDLAVPHPIQGKVDLLQRNTTLPERQVSNKIPSTKLGLEMCTCK